MDKSAALMGMTRLAWLGLAVHMSDVEKIQLDYMTMIDLSHPYPIPIIVYHNFRISFQTRKWIYHRLFRNYHTKYPIPIHSHETPRFLGQVMIPFSTDRKQRQNRGIRCFGGNFQLRVWNDPLNAPLSWFINPMNTIVYYSYLRTINHSYWRYKPTERYLGGHTLYVWYIYLQNWVIWFRSMLIFIFQHHGELIWAW